MKVKVGAVWIYCAGGGAVGIGSRVALETRGLMNDNETSMMDSQLKVNLSSVFC